MAIIIKNNGDNEWWLKDTNPGVRVKAGEQTDLELYMPRLQIVQSDQLLTDISNSSLQLVVNEGSKDLTLSQAIRYIFGFGQEMPISAMGQVRVEATKPTGGGSIRVSHDFCNPTTWYGDSVRIEDEVLGCPTGDEIHFRSDYKNWIDLTHGNVTREDDIINDTVKWPNGPFSVVVTVDDVVKTEGVDFIIDYKHGELSFEWPNPFNYDHMLGIGAVGATAVVKATYNHEHGSTWYLRPMPGMMMLISDTEVQFSQGVIFTSSVIFAPWINHPLAGWIPVPGESVTYKKMKDFLNEGNKGTGTIQAMGGDRHGIRYPASVFPFDYLSSKPLASSLQAELRVTTKNDIPIDGEFGTVTCYCREIVDPDYVAP